MGHYFGNVLLAEVALLSHGLRFGRALPVWNPFTSEAQERRLPQSITDLHDALVAQGIHKECELAARITEGMLEAGRQSFDMVLRDLITYERYGDGGPTHSFLMVVPDGKPLNMHKVLEGFTEALRGTELLTRFRVDWPRNARGMGACACCGYFTIVDPPASGQPCPICYWADSCDLADAWNMAKWGAEEIDDEMKEIYAEEPDLAPISIGEARRNFAACGAFKPRYAELSREPRGDETPRYDWAADPRPFAGPEKA